MDTYLILVSNNLPELERRDEPLYVLQRDTDLQTRELSMRALILKGLSGRSNYLRKLSV